MECKLPFITVGIGDNGMINQLYLAHQPISRLRGLLGYAPLKSHQGLWISPCNSIHMLGMQYPIDVVYLDRKKTVIKIIENILPWRFSFCLKAKSVIELNAGEVKKLNLKIGDQLKCKTE